MSGRYRADSDGDARMTRDAYGFALAALLISTLTLIAAGVPVRSFMALFAVAVQMLALILTFRVSGVKPRTFVVGVVAIVTYVALATAVTFVAGDGGGSGALAMWLVLVIAAIVAILRRVALYSHVTLQMVLGLLCIYLLLGLTFGLGYALVEKVAGVAFAQGPQGLSGAIYFSFITLATVGYGDLTPELAFVRAMAVSESILGQLYLVSVVSLAVSRLGTIRKAKPEQGDPA